MLLRAFFIFSVVGLFAMSREEKVGQLFMPFVMPEMGEAHINDAKHLIDAYKVGGFLVKWGTPEQKLGVVKSLRNWSEGPLLFACDAEWGAAMNTRGVARLPRQMTVAATGNHRYMLPYGYLCGLQCRSMGLHLVLGPVVDVNTNPNNPIIGTRSFGDDPGHVKRCADLQIRGLHSAGMLSCIKHFPGHGDTCVDSHYGLPTVEKGMRALRKCELLPFMRLQKRTDAIMTAHIRLPVIGEKPATMAPGVVTGLLRGMFRYQGVVITDALNMAAISKLYSPEEAAVGALKAGCDLLLYGAHKPEAVNELMRVSIPRAIAGVIESDISDDELDRHLARVAKLKENLRNEEGTFESFESEEVSNFTRQVFQEAVTLLRDPLSMVPLDREKEYYQYRDGEPPEDLSEVADGVIATLFKAPTQQQTEAINWCAIDVPTIVIMYCAPYGADTFSDNVSVLIAYEDHPEALRAVSRGLHGKFRFSGKLPLNSLSR